jgi:hypothetical protein
MCGVDADPHGETRSQVHPVEGTQAGSAQAADQVAIGGDDEADTFDDAFVAHAGARHDVDFGEHSGLNMTQLGLAKVGDDPPDAIVDEGEDMLPGSCVRALRNGEVGDARVNGGKRPVNSGYN